MKSSSAGQANTKTSTTIPNTKEKSPWSTLSNLHEAPRSPIRSAQEPRLATSAWLAFRSNGAVECRTERISQWRRNTAEHCSSHVQNIRAATRPCPIWGHRGAAERIKPTTYRRGSSRSAPHACLLGLRPHAQKIVGATTRLPPRQILDRKSTRL